MLSNERLAVEIQNRLDIVNQSMWNIFDAFEKSISVPNTPFFVDSEWLYDHRTLALRMGKGTGHSTFAKQLAEKHNAFLLTMDHEAQEGEFIFTHNRLREMYHKFGTPNIPSLFVIDDAYQFGGRFESLRLRLERFRDTLGEEYLRSVRFVLLN